MTKTCIYCKSKVSCSCQQDLRKEMEFLFKSVFTNSSKEHNTSERSTATSIKIRQSILN